MQESIFVNRGLQLLKSFHFNHQVKCISQQASESVAVFCHIGSENVVSVYPFKQPEQLLHYKYSVEGGFTRFIYSKKHQLFVASCPDLALRIFNERFDMLDTVHITSTALSLALNEVTSELYTGGVGCVNIWKLRHKLHNPLVAGPPLQCFIEKDQWVTCLECNGVSNKLIVVCQNCVIIVDTRTRKEVYRFASTYRFSLTCAILVECMGYLIIGAKDGCIKVWNCNLHYEVHTFTGHMKAVTGLKVHPNASCIISCSLDGTIRMWHLENMIECYHVKCGEVVLGMCSDDPLGNKLCTYSHHEVNLWEVKQLETHFTTVNSYVMNMFRVSCPDVSRSSTKLRFDVPRPPAKLRFNPPTKLRFDPTTKLRFDDVSGSPTKLRFDVSGPPTQLRFDDVSGPPTKLLFDNVSEPPTTTCFDESGPPAKLRFDVSRLPGPAKICLTEPRSLTRIVALAEDDGLRLLSPVSGQILTILFPMFSAQMLVDVVYLLGEEQLFVLLRMGVVLVVSTATNPCSTLQLWAPTLKNSIHCIATVTIVLKNGSKVSLIFGGQQSGDIILIHNLQSRLSMPNPCPSHFGPVIKLIGSCDPIWVTEGNHYALVSYGEDKILNIWSIEVDRTSHIYLKVNQCVYLEPVPTFTCLLGSSLCMAIDNKLVMVPLSELEDSRSVIPQLFFLSDLPLLTHEKYDDHTAAIISLSCSEELELFATSSKDGMVKIWNSTGQLVSELEFGESLAAVCFSNSRGDLLVGFQNHICVIKAEDYLTSNYVSNDVDVVSSEVQERPITFDSELKFWYDVERVPTLPAEQELRDNLPCPAKPVTVRTIRKLPKPSPLQTIIDMSEESLLSDQQEACVSEHQLQALVDVGLAQSVSKQYSMVLQRERRQSEISVGHQTSSSHQSEALSNDSAQSLATPTISWGSELPYPSSHSFMSQDSAPLVQVTPLESPSIRRPIAPDGLIPNSIIRSILRYEPSAVERPSTYKPLAFKRRFCLEKFTPSPAGYRRALLTARYSWENIACVSSFDTETDYRKNNTRSIPMNMLRARLKKRKRLWSPIQTKATRSRSGKKKGHHAKISGHEVDSNDSFSGSNDSISRSKCWEAKKRRTKSAMGRFSVSRERMHTKGKNRKAPEVLDVNEVEVDELRLLIQRICGKPWFPKDAMRRARKARRTTRSRVKGNCLTVDELFSELVSLLKTCKSLTFVEVCQALLELNHAGVLSAEQQRTFAFCLVERNNNPEPQTFDTRRTNKAKLYPDSKPNNDDTELTNSTEWTNSTKSLAWRVNNIGRLKNIGRLNNGTEERTNSTWPHINSTGSHINSVEWRSSSTKWTSSIGKSNSTKGNTKGRTNSIDQTNSTGSHINSTKGRTNSTGQSNSTEWRTNSTGRTNSTNWRTSSTGSNINKTKGSTKGRTNSVDQTNRSHINSTEWRTNSTGHTNSTKRRTNNSTEQINSSSTLAGSSSTMGRTSHTLAGTTSTLAGSSSTMGRTSSTMGRTSRTLAGTTSTLAGCSSTSAGTSSTMTASSSIKGQRVSIQTLKTLEQLGVCTEEILSVILPKLTDTSSELREAAFATLRSITGISNRSQLYQLLCDLGVLRNMHVDEDEVIGELTERVRKGQVKPPPSPTFFKAQATKTELAPLSIQQTVATPSSPTDHSPLEQPLSRLYPRWDKVIRELTKRVRKGQIKPPSRTFFDTQAAKTQLSPLSSQQTVATPSSPKHRHPLEHTLPHHTHSHHQDEVIGELTERARNGQVKPPSLVDAQAAKTQLSPLGTVATLSLPKHHHPLEHTLPPHTHSHHQDEVIEELAERARNGQVKPRLLFDPQAVKAQLSLLRSQQTVAAPSSPKHHHPLEHTLPPHTHSHPQDEVIGELTERARNGQVKPPSLFDAQATKTQLSLLGTVAAPSLPKHHHPLEHTLPHHTHSHPQDEAIGELTERARNGQVKPPSLFDAQATKTQLSSKQTVAAHSLPLHHHTLEHTLPPHTHSHPQDEVIGELTERARNGQIQLLSLFDAQSAKTPLGTVVSPSLPKHRHPLEHALPHHTHSHPQDDVIGELTERARNGQVKPLSLNKTQLDTVAAPSSPKYRYPQEHTLPHHTHYLPTQLRYHTLPLDSTRCPVGHEQGSYLMTQSDQNYQPFLTAKTIATGTPHQEGAPYQDKLNETICNPSQTHPTGEQRVLMTHPHTLSQCPRAIEFMMRSMVNRKTEKGKFASAYRWSDVYPVISKSLSRGSVMENACTSDCSCIAN